jgi:glycosyltransferase involved in cell wall biosynthesis
MKLLLIHNPYTQPGGEDSAFEFEACLLERAGYDVHRLIASNAAIRGVVDTIRAAWTLPWNRDGYERALHAIRGFGPDVMHVHNFFAMFSPAIYDAAAASHIPVVQTLHNFRITCANGQLSRDGAPCERCISGSPYNAVRFRCYRGSYAGSLALARMIAFHRRERTWQTKISRFIVLSEFARSRFISAGVPAEKIVVKPNGAADCGARDQAPGKGVLFVGRLSREKGVHILIEAAKLGGYPVRIVGDGPLRTQLEACAPPNVTFVGYLSHDDVITEMRRARCVAIPSVCYENSPIALVEAYSVGVPVVGPRLGSIIELVEEGVTGFQFASGKVEELNRALKCLIDNPALASQMGHASRQRYLEQFTPDRILSKLEAIYRSIA